MKKKTAKKPSARNSTTASRNGDADGQKYIPGTEPPRIPLLDRELKTLATRRREITSAKDEESKLLTSIARRMHDVKLNRYKGAGFTVDIVPSAENVKVKPAKDK